MARLDSVIVSATGPLAQPVISICRRSYPRYYRTYSELGSDSRYTSITICQGHSFCLRRPLRAVSLLLALVLSRQEPSPVFTVKLGHETREGRERNC